MSQFARRWVLPVLYFTDNWMSRAGLALLLTSTVLWIFLTGASTASGYLGILQFVALPAAFFAGLALIPIGMKLQRRRDEHLLPDKIDLASPQVRRFLTFVAAATFVNLVIGGALTYQTVHYMESNNFCTTACHVMEPEHRAFAAGSHTQLKCVQCHVGEGAGNMIRAKLNGTRQLFQIITGGYSRPIPSPPHELKSAAETCENCHSADHDYGNRLWRRTQFEDDGTRTETALLMPVTSIHNAHQGMEYDAADPAREKILAVQTPKGEYTNGEPKANAALHRKMDCLDCHNRPAHEFENPERAVDRMMASGRLPQTLPRFRTVALEVLRGRYSNPAGEIPTALAKAYPTNPEARRASTELIALYERNIFPEMNITWGTYPQHIGHTDSPGCFRCHGGSLTSKQPIKAITEDCEACHKILNAEELGG